MPRDAWLQAHGVFTASSSPALMATLLGRPALTPATRPIQPMAMAPWRFRPELRTLLAGQTLHPASGRLASAGHSPLVVHDSKPDEIRERAAQLLSTSLSRLHARHGKRLSCALTGG